MDSRCPPESPHILLTMPDKFLVAEKVSVVPAEKSDRDVDP